MTRAATMIRFACAALAASALALAAGGARAAENTTIFSFAGGDGRNPVGIVADPSGVLYGTTLDGGMSKNCKSGCGTVFRLLPPSAPGMPWRHELLHSFDGTDGSQPEGAPIVDSQGNVFGSTQHGGSVNAGVIWELSPAAGDGWMLSILHDFTLSGDAGDPGGIVMSSAGVIYAVTLAGGASPPRGTVYALAPPAQSGQDWIGTILHAFTKQQGSPGLTTPVLTGNDTQLEGLTGFGESQACYGCGRLFHVSLTTPPGFGFRSYIPQDDQTGGLAGPLLINRDHTLYFASTGGGATGAGAVETLSPPSTPGGDWITTTIYSFSAAPGNGGDSPAGGLVRDRAGSLFGTASQAGTDNHGTVYRLDPPTAGGTVWTYTVLHAFTGSPGSDTTRADGAFPLGQLVFGYKHHLYGVTGAGGRLNRGTVFMQSLH